MVGWRGWDKKSKGKESSGDVPLYWLIHPYVLKSGTWPNGVGEKWRQMAPCGLEGTQGFTPSQRCKIRALNAHDSFGVVDIYPIIQIAGFRLACIPRIYFDFLFILNLDFFNEVLLLLASKRVSRSVHGGQATPRSWVEEERTNPCRCQPWALDIGHYAALKTLKDLSAKTLILFISQILPWLFWGLQPVLENLFFSEQQCPEQPNASQLLEG